MFMGEKNHLRGFFCKIVSNQEPPINPVFNIEERAVKVIENVHEPLSHVCSTSGVPFFAECFEN
jgi:hypothetical protein